MRITGRLTSLFILIFAAGCAGSGAGTGGGERVRNTVRVNLGTSTAGHIVKVGDEQLAIQNGYQFERRVVTEEDIRMITYWREFPATADERQLGYGFVQIRVTLRARPRDRTAGTYSANLLIELEGRGPTNDIWEKIEVTEERDVFLEEMINRMENEFKGGVRPND